MINVYRYAVGVVAGVLLTLGVVGIGFERGLLFPEQKPVVNTVIKEVQVVKTVYVTRRKLYRAKVLNYDGKVIGVYDNITNFQFKIIGATLTNKRGRQFDVDGTVTIEEVQ